MTAFYVSHVINIVFHQSTLTKGGQMHHLNLGRWHKTRSMAENSVDVTKPVI